MKHYSERTLLLVYILKKSMRFHSFALYMLVYCSGRKGKGLRMQPHSVRGMRAKEGEEKNREALQWPITATSHHQHRGTVWSFLIG